MPGVTIQLSRETPNSDVSTIPSGRRPAANRATRRSNWFPRRSSVTRSKVAEWAVLRFGGQLDEALALSINESFTFDGAPELRRGVRLSRVTQGCGSIFSSSAGVLANYEMSEEADRFGYFLSHNWSVSRWSKNFALCFAFNFHLALAMGIFLVIIVAVLTSLHLLPLVHEGDLQSTWVARLIVVPMMTITLLFGSNLLSKLGLRDPDVFLDKVCIHQTNEEVKQQGISKLGAFLDCSDRMLILYTDVYLQKLWTIYEVATFQSLRSVFEVDVIPVQLPAVVFATIPCGYAFTTVLMLWCYISDTQPGSFRYLFPGLCSIGFMIFLRRWAREKARTVVQLKEFDVRNCMCAVEADRQVIYAKIADLMRVVHHNLRNATQEEALEAFNEQIRLRMPLAFGYIFGMTTLHYQHLLFISVNVVGTRAADYAYFDSSAHTEEILCYWAHEAAWTFTFWPALGFFAEVFASSCLSIRRFNLLWVLFSLCAIGCPFALLHSWMQGLVERSGTGKGAARLSIVVSCSSILSTWLLVALYRCVRSQAAHHLESRKQNGAGCHTVLTETIGLSGEKSTEADDDSQSVFSL